MPLFLLLFALEVGRHILQEKSLAALVSRNGGEQKYHFRNIIPVTNLPLDLQRATAKSVAYVGHLCIIRPLFSLTLLLIFFRLPYL